MRKACPLLLFALILSLMGCSGLEQSEQTRIRKFNEKGEYIYRESDEHQFDVAPPRRQAPEYYPWEGDYTGSFPKITKEFFRCKGSTQNPARLITKENGEKERLFDCSGAHSLFVVDEQEFVYPILSELLNRVQKETGKRVVITSGHRCPKHNTFADESKENRTSKHMIGAEVDFYVQGMEEEPKKIIEILLNYYKKGKEFEGKEKYQEFKLYHGPTNVSITPLFNKEVFIKHFQKNEGRDLDNRHSFPYISIQVRYDRDSQKKSQLHLGSSI